MEAIFKCEMGKWLDSQPKGLESLLTAGGSNLSVGERQSLCLARAIVKEAKIIVLDEATANLDGHTDALIQRTLARECAGCTKLIVAHRLNTIIDSDHVLVLDDGRLVEQGKPWELLRGPTTTGEEGSENEALGFFASMLRETGEEMERKLREDARAAWEAKRDCAARGNASVGVKRHDGKEGERGEDLMDC